MAHSANESDAILQQLLERRKNRTLGAAAAATTDGLPLDVGYGFATVFVVLGFAAIVLNGLILSILLRRHRYVFKHVFYLLIVNFTIIDTLKGACMILWAIKTFAPAGGNLLILKLDQLTLLLLRFCNLATILNLLMITLNEFCFIVYPFRYRTLITKARAIALVLFCWLLSWTFTVVTMLMGSNQQRIIVDKACIKQQQETAQVERRQLSSTGTCETLTHFCLFLLSLFPSSFPVRRFVAGGNSGRLVQPLSLSLPIPHAQLRTTLPHELRADNSLSSPNWLSAVRPITQLWRIAFVKSVDRISRV